MVVHRHYYHRFVGPSVQTRPPPPPACYQQLLTVLSTTFRPFVAQINFQIGSIHAVIISLYVSNPKTAPILSSTEQRGDTTLKLSTTTPRQQRQQRLRRTPCASTSRYIE